MPQSIATGIFKPALSKTESKSDATNRVAREINDKEAAARIAKTARLKAIREAREAGADPTPPPAPKTSSRKRKS